MQYAEEIDSFDKKMLRALGLYSDFIASFDCDDYTCCTPSFFLDHHGLRHFLPTADIHPYVRFMLQGFSATDMKIHRFITGQRRRETLAHDFRLSAREASGARSPPSG